MRLGRCEALASDLGPWARVSDIEQHLKKPSFSIDSLNALAVKHPNYSFRFVIGSDVLPDLPKWKSWNEIESKFRPIVVGRDGYDNPDDSVVFPGVSSSEVRARLQEGLVVRHLLTVGVYKLILEEVPF